MRDLFFVGLGLDPSRKDAFYQTGAEGDGPLRTAEACRVEARLNLNSKMLYQRKRQAFSLRRHGQAA